VIQTVKDFFCRIPCFSIVCVVKLYSIDVVFILDDYCGSVVAELVAGIPEWWELLKVGF